MLKLIYLVSLLYIPISVSIWLLLVFGIIITLILGRIVKKLLSLTLHMHIEFLNTLKLSINIIQIIIIFSLLYVLLIDLGVNPEAILWGTAFIATAIGISSTSIASNVVGGIYIIFTRPFSVGDVIKTQGMKGIVEEIGLNYTKIVRIDRTTVSIPNGNLINSSLLNYRTMLPDMQKRKIRFFSLKSSNNEEVIRYKAKIELKLDIVTPPIPLKHVKVQLDRVCDQFEPILGFRPLFYFGRHQFRQVVNLIVIARDGFIIFTAWPYLLEAIAKNVYSSIQEEGAS